MKTISGLFTQITGLLLLSTTASANPISITEKIYLEGTIGKSNVLFELSISGGSVNGRYAYKKYMTPITISGTLENNKLTLTEASKLSTQPIITGTFENGKITGYWKSNKKHTLQLDSKVVRWEKLFKKIDINTSNGESILTFDSTDGKAHSLDINSHTKKPKLIFEDLDFDGYPDLRTADFDNSTNDTYIYYRYSPSKKMLIPFTSPVKDIVNPKIIYSQKILTGISKDGCCNYAVTFIKGKAIAIARYDYTSNRGTLTTTSTTNTTNTVKLSRSDFENEYLNKISEHP